MRTKALLTLTVVVAVLLLLASPAFAGQVTRIQYGLENWVTYEYTPTQTGTLDISISWTDSEGNATTFPRSEVDGVVQMYDNASKENYYDIDVASLYAGTNPQVGSVSITTQLVNKPVYISVVPWIDDCQYHIVVTFRGATVIDATGTAYGHSGEFYMPATAAGGTWLSVLQTWPGTLNRGAGTSDVWANWDDYAWEVDPAGAGTLANAWQVDANSYVPPLRTQTAIDGRDGIADKWYIVAPEIWTAAARPNVWTKIATDLYPKPGTLAYNAAPLWYTYSWTDTAVADAPAYMWGNVATTSASGHAWNATSLSSARMTYKFFGPTLTWVYTTGPKGGIQRVIVDGTQIDTVDQYSATAAYKVSKTWSNLGAGAHTVTIESTRSKNPASGGFFIYHDAFVAPGFSGDANPISQNNSDGMTQYFLGKTSVAGASGGSFSSDKSASSAVAFTFSGTSITWKYLTAPKGGIQRVWIDGVEQTPIDQYSASVTYNQTKTYSGLAAGLHTILIRGSGQKNASSGGFFIYHDAFIVGSTTIED